MEERNLEELLNLYNQRKGIIKRRVNEFEEIWNSRDEEKIFEELIFCILTPQCSARNAFRAVMEIKGRKLHFNGDLEEISRVLLKNKVPFALKKANYFIEAREKFIKMRENGNMALLNFLKGDEFEIRESLVKNIKGFGYKESSHFLRNIGLSKELAILDRHILKNLKNLGVISNIPESMTRNKYLEIERKMLEFSKKINIPLNELDLLFWSKETGEVFK